jgi:hypothetical protein
MMMYEVFKDFAGAIVTIIAAVAAVRERNCAVFAFSLI